MLYSSLVQEIAVWITTHSRSLRLRRFSSEVPQLHPGFKKMKSWTVFYAKVAAVCFALGASMELFMIKTGFYEK